MRFWGVAYGGMTGGLGIVIADGVETAYATSADGYRHAQLVHRMQSAASICRRRAHLSSRRCIIRRFYLSIRNTDIQPS